MDRIFHSISINFLALIKFSGTFYLMNSNDSNRLTQTATTLTDHEKEIVISLINQTGIISAIRHVRSLLGCDLKQAKDIAESLREEAGKRFVKLSENEKKDELLALARMALNTYINFPPNGNTYTAMLNAFNKIDTFLNK